MRLAPLYRQDRDRAAREGEERGLQQGKEAIALNMLRVGMDIEQIANLTQLPLERVRELQQQNNENGNSSQ